MADVVGALGHAVQCQAAHLSRQVTNLTYNPVVPDEVKPARLFVRLRAEREQQDFAMQQIADRIGVTKQSISEWETGESNPGLPALRKWVKTLKVPEAEIDEWIEEQAVQRVEAIMKDKGRLGREIRKADVETLLVAVRKTLRANR